jgi:O-succinylbenzoate synthase
VRDVLLVHVIGPDTEGWGECVAEAAPSYTSEYVDGAQEVMKRFLLPAIDRHDAGVGSLDDSWRLIEGHPMAKAAIEAAMLDAGCRLAGSSLAESLEATADRVAAGVAVGLQPSVDALLAAVESYLAEGYQRMKLKIARGREREIVEPVRERFPDVALQVDANQAYTLHDVARLQELDAFKLTMIEQPLAADDLLGHAELARQLQTPICLDESITSAEVSRTALALEACAVVCIKPGRVGGLLEARRIHDLCVEAGVPVWCGGMLETGIGRAGNVALAALPGFTLPGDLSASARYFHRDVTEPFVLEDGCLRVPTGPGIGVSPLPDVLAELTTSVETIRLS